MLLFSVLAIRVAFAVVLNAGAFIVWDVGTRPPLTLFADVRRALGTRRGIAAGAIRFVCGLALIWLAALAVGPVMPDRRTFTVAETGILIAALLLEMLVGPALRRTRR
ncbi:MAG TPA: hypothetical protein VMD91_14570 [Candidatus Sulfotelmatobacter sp.]|nr:hypothetical protein [Candidatus Sulfotelmatobacter sp.]